MKYNILLLLVFFIGGGLAGCDTWRDNPLDFNHTITVKNETDCRVIVTLDDGDALNLPESGDFGVFEAVSEGEHLLVAYREVEKGSPEEFARLIITVTERKDYTWTLESCEDAG